MLKLWINGVEAREVGAKVLRLPFLVVPEKRVRYITIPGRSGFLSKWDGDYETVDRVAVISYQGNDVRKVLDWIDVARTVKFGNEPITYDCLVSTKVSADKKIANWYEIQITFTTQPKGTPG